jgi:hypothetical protein
MRKSSPASAIVFVLLFSTAAFAQSGTCPGMTAGQLTSLNGFVPFSSTSLWNADISSAPVDPNSANIINYIGSSVTLHPDFGAGTYQNRAWEFHIRSWGILSQKPT